MTSRVITKNESAILALIRTFEKMIEAGNSSFLIQLTEAGMFQVYRGEEAGFYRTISVAEGKDERGQVTYYARFWMHDFEQYLHFTLQQAGMALLENYRVVLEDGFTIEV